MNLKLLTEFNVNNTRKRIFFLKFHFLFLSNYLLLIIIKPQFHRCEIIDDCFLSKESFCCQQAYQINFQFDISCKHDVHL